MGKVNRKRNAVRMLKQAIRLTERTANSRMSGRATGRLMKEMHKYLAVLKRLEQDDPSTEDFWETLHKAVATVLRCLRHVDR